MQLFALPKREAAYDRHRASRLGNLGSEAITRTSFQDVARDKHIPMKAKELNSGRLGDAWQILSPPREKWMLAMPDSPPCSQLRHQCCRSTDSGQRSANAVERWRPRYTAMQHATTAEQESFGYIWLRTTLERYRRRDPHIWTSEEFRDESWASPRTDSLRWRLHRVPWRAGSPGCIKSRFAESGMLPESHCPPRPFDLVIRSHQHSSERAGHKW